MIVKIRIDDRLLHGQVAFSWKAALDYDAIIIANDSAANDDLRKKAFKMAKPSNVKLATRNIHDAAELSKNELLADLKVYIICANPKDAFLLYELIEETPVLNLGGMQKTDDSVFFSPAVYVTKEDIEFLDKIHGKNIEIEVKQVPDEKNKKYHELRNKISFN